MTTAVSNVQLTKSSGSLITFGMGGGETASMISIELGRPVINSYSTSWFKFVSISQNTARYLSLFLVYSEETSIVLNSENKQNPKLVMDVK